LVDSTRPAQRMSVQRVGCCCFVLCSYSVCFGEHANIHAQSIVSTSAVQERLGSLLSCTTTFIGRHHRPSWPCCPAHFGHVALLRRMPYKARRHTWEAHTGCCQGCSLCSDALERLAPVQLAALLVAAKQRRFPATSGLHFTSTQNSCCVNLWTTCRSAIVVSGLCGHLEAQ
jgi:hypothetical protein